mmetsp:Transcript_10240/g.30420  ORF Transcript_10240/g.30420 Transcript_10240/m.30420 type:complete len:270 (+) Transcript_10240:1197-2006(+)
MWPRLSTQPQSGSTVTWRAEKGTAASAWAALRTSSLSRPRPPCRRAQSASVRAATVARARKWRPWLAGWPSVPSTCRSTRSSSRSRFQWPFAETPSRTQKRQIAETAASSTGCDRAGRLTMGRRMVSRVPNSPGSLRRSECDHRNSAVMMASTRRQRPSRSVFIPPCCFLSSASSFSTFWAACFTFCASMKSSSAMAFFFAWARAAFCFMSSSTPPLRSCSCRLRRVVKWSSLAPLPCSGWQMSLTRRTTRVLHSTSSDCDFECCSPRP